MCQICGCSPCSKCGRDIIDRVCKGCGKKATSCTCKAL